MTRGNRILSTLVFPGLLMLSLNGAARSQSTPPKTVTISGSTGVAGVTLRGFPGAPVTTDENAFYSVEVPQGWAGTITPVKLGYTFHPPSRVFTAVVESLENQDYAATLLMYRISGNTGLAGAAIKGLPEEVVGDANGAYTATVPYGWSGDVMPYKDGYVFEPTRRTYRRVNKDSVKQDYTAQRRMVAISNVLMADREPLEGVRIVAEPGGYSARTDAQGRYRIEVPYGWSGELVFQGEFEEPGAGRFPYANVTSDIIEGPRVKGRSVTISNVVQVGSEPIQGVKVTAKPGEYTALTDSHGRYRIQVPYGWSGRLVLSKEGWDIRSETEYSGVARDIIDGKSVPAGREWPPYEPGASRGGVSVPAGDVLVIPTADASPERIAETTEDLRVMLQILREKLSEPRMIRGVLRDYGSLLGEDRRAEAIYLEGSAAMFVIGADFPPSSPAQQSGESDPQGRPQSEAADPVWQRARESLYSPGGARSRGGPGPSSAMTFEQFRDELLHSLKHAGNIRYVDPNELVVLTIVAQNENANWPDNPASADPYGDAGGRGRGGRRRTVVSTLSSATVLTMQARKADVDAFAQGTLDFDQFRRKVRSFTY